MDIAQGNDSRTTFGYPIRSDKEIGFFVVCSDRMIMDDINSILKRKGMVGISDTAGRMHYLVDARRNIHAAAQKIAEEAKRKFDMDSISETQLMQAAEKTLTKYRLDRSLLGTRILRSLLVYCVKDPSLLNSVTKQLYPLVGKEFGVTASQIERNLRYAFYHTPLHRDGYRNVQSIRHLYDDLLRSITSSAHSNLTIVR